MHRTIEEAIIHNEHYRIGYYDPKTRKNGACYGKDRDDALQGILPGFQILWETGLEHFIIDYRRVDGRKDFKTVQAATPEDAVRIFQAAGIDGWTGIAFKDYEITSVTERGC